MIFSEGSPSDRDQFDDLADPLNVLLDPNGNPVFTGNPGPGLERTRVLRGAGASLPINYFTRYIPEVALETTLVVVTVTSIEPIYRDISGFYSNELDMQIELGSDLRAIDEITGEMVLTRAGERVDLKLGGVGGSEVAPDSGEFFIDIGSSRITMLPGYVWQGYLPAPGDYLDAPVMMTFSARDHEFYGRHLATITVGRPPLTIALPQRRAPSVKFLGANLTLANAVGEAILKNSAGQTLASDYLTLNYEVSLGFESTEYDRVSYPRPGDANSATREKIITLDGYFEPVAQALINSSSPHLNIWGGGLDRPEFLDSDYEFGVQRDLKIGRDVMFSRDARFSDIAGIVNDGLTVVRRPAYEVTVEVESRRPGEEPQLRMVTLTASARDATPTRTDSFAYLTGGASYEGVALSVSSRALCPASTDFGMVTLLVEPDVPLAGQVRYARPRYHSAMVGGEGARATIALTLSEYSDSTLFYDENSLLSPAGGESVFVSLRIHHESTYPGEAFSFYDGVSGPVASVTLRFTSARSGFCDQDPTSDTSLTLNNALGGSVTVFIFSSCPESRDPGWIADFYIVETGGATIARARAPYDLGSPRGETTVVFANRVVGGVKNFSIDDSNIPVGHNAFLVNNDPVTVQVNPALSPNFQNTVFAVQYDPDDSDNILSVPFSLSYYNAASPPLSIAYHHNAANIVTVRTLDLPSIDTPRPGRFQGSSFQVRSEPAEVIDARASPNNDYVWGKNAPPRSFRIADQNHGLRVDLSTPRTVPLIGDMFVFLDRGYDPTRFGGTLQTLPLGGPSDPGGGFKIEGYAALVAPLGASGNDEGARYAYAQRSEMFSVLFDSRPLRDVYDFIDTGNCGSGGCAALFNSPEWAAVLSGVVGLQAVNVDFSDRTDRWRENIYFVLPHDVVAIRSDRSGLVTANAPQPEITLSFSFPHEELANGTILTALDYSMAINLSDADISYMSGDYRSLANGEAVVIELRAAREDENESVVRFALTPEAVVSVNTVLAGVRGGDVNVWRISIASSYTREDGVTEAETDVVEIPLAENPYARLSKVTRIGSQPVTLLAGSLLYPHSGRVVPASRFPGSGNIRLIRNGGTIAAIGAIDGAYRQPLPVGGLHGSRFGFYKGELAPLDVVLPADSADCFVRVVDIEGREERIDVEGAYRVGDAPDFLTQPVPYYERTLPLLTPVELDYTGAISPTLTAALAMMNNIPDTLENSIVTLTIAIGDEVVVDLSADIYESGSAGALFAGEDVIITVGLRTIYLRLGSPDSLRHFEYTGSIPVEFTGGGESANFNLTATVEYTGASFADLVFALNDGDQRLTLSRSGPDVVLGYDRSGLNNCMFNSVLCAPTSASEIRTALENYPQGAVSIDAGGLIRPLIVLRDGSFTATINLADNLYYTAGQYSRLRAGFAVTVSPDIGSVPRHEFEIFPTGGGRHRVRPLLPSHIYTHSGFARNVFDPPLDVIRDITHDAIGNVSYTVNMAIDASYDTSSPLDNVPETTDIYSALYAHQQIPSTTENRLDNLTAAFSSLAGGDGSFASVTVILRVRPGASRIAFCTPTATPNPRCQDVLNGRISLRDPNNLQGAPNPAAEYSVFLPLPVFDLFPTINLMADLPEGMTFTRNVFLGHPTLYAAGSNYGILQSGSAVTLNPDLFVQGGYTVHFSLRPLGGGALRVDYFITPGNRTGGYSLPFIDLPLLLIGTGRTTVDLNDPAFYAPDPDDPARPIFLTLSPGIPPGAVNTRVLNLLSGHEFLDERLGQPASTSDLLGKFLLDDRPLCDAPNRRGAFQFCVQRANDDEIALYQIEDRGSAVTLTMSDLGFNANMKTPQRNECVPLVGYSPANSYPYGGFRIGTVPTPTVYSCVRIVGATEGAGDELLFQHFIAGNENGQPFREERFPYLPTGSRVELIPVSVVATIGYPTYEVLLDNPEFDPVLTIDLNDPRSYLDGEVLANFPDDPTEMVALITLTLAFFPGPQTLYLQDATATVNTDFNFVALPASLTVAARFDGKISINSYASAEPLLPGDQLVFIEEPLSDREVVVEPGELRYISEWHGGGNGPFLIDSGDNANTDRYLSSQPPNPYSSVYFDPALEIVPGTETRIATGDKTDFRPVRTWHFIEANRGDLLNINSPNISLGGDRMEDPHRREYEPVGNIYEMTADPGYWASAQPQLSHTRANYIVGGLDGFGGGLSVSMTIVGGETRMVTVESPGAFADGRAFAIVDSRGVANPSNAANYRTPYRQTQRPFGWKFLTRSQTPAMPLRDAFSSVPQYYNVWYRLRDDSRYLYSDSAGVPQPDIGIPAGSIVNPVQGTYVTPPSQFAAIGADGSNIRYHNRFGSLNSDLNLRPPAMILPAGAVFIVGGSPQTSPDDFDRLPRITNVQAAVFFSLRPLSGIECELASEPRFPDAPVQVVVNQQAPVSLALRNAASVAIEARSVSLTVDIERRTQYIAGIEKFTLGHPCEWLDEIENSDGDSLFFYRSRDAIGGRIGARHIGNDRTYIMGGRIQFNGL